MKRRKMFLLAPVHKDQVCSSFAFSMVSPFSDAQFCVNSIGGGVENDHIKGDIDGTFFQWLFYVQLMSSY